MNDLEFLTLEAATIFVLTSSGRILRRNSPDGAPGPRFHLKGSPQGNVLHLVHEVSEPTAAALERLAAEEPPLSSLDRGAVHLDEYVRLLDAERPVERCDPEMLWCIPPSPQYDHPASLVLSDSPEGDQLRQRFIQFGMPEAFFTAGFVDVGELWWPWCIALDGKEVASVAFAAGLGPASAEVGVYTVPSSRGRGFAAAAVAGWASHPALRGRTLFYGASRSNSSSRRVTERLGLRFIGSTLSIT